MDIAAEQTKFFQSHGITPGIAEKSRPTGVSSAPGFPDGFQQEFGIGNAPPALTPNIWMATASQTLAAIDVYNQSGKDIITNVESLKAKLNPALLTGLLGNKGMADKLKMATELLGNSSKLLLGQKEILGRIAAQVPGLKGLANTITDSELGKSIGSAFKTGSEIYTSVEGQVVKVRSEFLGDLRNFEKTIVEATGIKEVLKVVDTDAIRGLSTAMIHQASYMGLSNTFGTILGKLDQNTLDRVCNDALPHLMQKGDILSIRELAKAGKSSNIGKLHPTFLHEISEAFKLDAQQADSTIASGKDYRMYLAGTHDWDPTTGVTAMGGIEERFNSMHGVLGCFPTDTDGKAFSAILDTYDYADSGWRIIDRLGDTGPSKTVNLSPFVEGNPDFKAVMNSGLKAADGNHPDAVLAFAGAFDATDVLSDLERSMPYTVLGVPGSSRISDPFNFA